MAIPKIASYALPQGDEIPAALVSWTPSPSRAALLIHDMQRYFVEPFDRRGSPIAEVIANIDGLAAACRALGIPVFYTAQHGGQDRRDRGLQADFWGPGMEAKEEHEAIVAELAPEPDDFRLVKHRYSAFQRSNLLDLMRARGRDQLVICGVYAHIGCMATAADAFQYDVEPFLIADAVAAFSRETHDLALRTVAGCCGAVPTTADVLAVLRPAAAAPATAAERRRLTPERMRADVAAILHEDPAAIAFEDDLLDLGLDSMRVMTLLVQWNAEGMELEFSDIAEHRTLAGWWQVVSARLAAAGER